VQCKRIGERLKQRITFLDRVFIAAKILEGAGEAASLLIGGGVLLKAFKEGGKILLVKTIAKTAVAGGISYIAGKAVDAGLRAAGVEEETIQGVKHAAELVTWLLLLRKIHKSLPSRVEPIKSGPKTSSPTTIERPPQQRLLPASKPSRVIQDRNVNSIPPRSLRTNRKISGNKVQQRALAADVRRLRLEGARDIRVNQQQVNAAGERVGLNRPDLQYTRPDGTRVYVEYDNATPGSFPNTPRGPMHAARILANDPLGVIELRRFP
jgi:hypothetical protein